MPKRELADDAGSELERAYLFQLRATRVVLPEREVRFHPTRKWRMDFAWPEKRVGAEVDGGQWVNGRHNRGSSFEEDCVKGSEAAILGWRVLHFTGKMVDDGRALDMTIRALAWVPRDYL